MSAPDLATSPPEDPPVHADDHAIIATSLSRPEAFGDLFDRHAGELHRFLARRLGDLADDLLGELFVTAFEHRHRYRAELPDARPWLYGIATTLIGQHRRAETRRYRALMRAGHRVGGGAESYDDRVADAVQLELLRLLVTRRVDGRTSPSKNDGRPWGCQGEGAA